MKALNNRVEKLEGYQPDEGITIERTLISCEGQHRHPELYKKVKIRDGLFELKPKNPNYTCKCRMCKNS